jgi:hypothetical protein
MRNEARHQSKKQWWKAPIIIRSQSLQSEYVQTDCERSVWLSVFENRTDG